jgi:hypothetical protein
MGYFAPPAKAKRGATALFKAAKRNRKAKAKPTASFPTLPFKETAVERSLIWAWRTIC